MVSHIQSLFDKAPNSRVKGFKAFTMAFGINLRFALVEHPQTNGHVKSANKIILNGLQKRLDQEKGEWIEELAKVLWVYYTSIHNAENTFQASIGFDTMVILELLSTSIRVGVMNQSTTNTTQRKKQDLLQETRDLAQITKYIVKLIATNRFNTKVKP